VVAGGLVAGGLVAGGLVAGAMVGVGHGLTVVTGVTGVQTENFRQRFQQHLLPWAQGEGKTFLSHGFCA